VFECCFLCINKDHTIIAAPDGCYTVDRLCTHGYFCKTMYMGGLICITSIYVSDWLIFMIFRMSKLNSLIAFHPETKSDTRFNLFISLKLIFYSLKGKLGAEVSYIIHPFKNGPYETCYIYRR